MDTTVNESNEAVTGYDAFPKLFPYDTFEQTVGPLFHKNESNAWSFKFKVTHKHLNPLGRLHGEMIMTFIDHTLGGTAFHAVGNRPCITVGLHIDFIAGAKNGDWVEGNAKINRVTGNLVFASGELHVQGKLIAIASGVWRTVEFGN